MQTKYKAFDHFKSFEAWLETQYGISINKLHLDQGGEFMDGDFSLHVQKAGTVH